MNNAIVEIQSEEIDGMEHVSAHDQRMSITESDIDVYERDLEALYLEEDTKHFNVHQDAKRRRSMMR